MSQGSCESGGIEGFKLESGESKLHCKLQIQLLVALSGAAAAAGGLPWWEPVPKRTAILSSTQESLLQPMFP